MNTNAKTEIFTSKEQYLYFRKMWADYVNSGKSVHAYHHVIYNILREKDPFCGFTEITNKNKLANGMVPNHYRAWVDWKMSERNFENAVAPFGGTISNEMFMKVLAIFKAHITKQKEAA